MTLSFDLCYLYYFLNTKFSVVIDLESLGYIFMHPNDLGHENGANLHFLTVIKP